ncbi:outer membrane receptor protein involved in Fe transport [Pedobacter cryoconitis]|uniref:Outer membrane receptor protein involved in Fe transport n=1 Tax=Pedobacter cryoconitis TaxID=188932 RepID=A0A7W8ZMU9_9SPHI|nr:TonB-dependent receptor [Pedobacter cryoconitis]MBB5636933.1 outer membrane receptor protein involved in Fe transport [Pedobacter cryoconitis]
MKKKAAQFLIFILIIIIHVIPGYSQQAKPGGIGKGQLNGKITDEKSIPVMYAVVNLIKASDSTRVKSVITTENGAFTFNQLDEDAYFVTIEWIGYQKKFNGPFVIDANHQLLNIEQLVILPETNQLNTVSIVGKKPLIERKSDMMIMNIANSTLAAGNTALEIITKAPGVTVDNNGNISLRGKAGVNIMIDGKLTYLSNSQLTNLLRTTDGNSIQAIELMTNPSAKYDAAGTGGIINIRLKKNMNYGTNGTLTAGGGYGKYYKSNGGITLNHRSKNINVSGNYNYVNTKDFETLNITRSITSENENTYFDQRGREVTLRKNNSYKAGIDYYLNKKNVIGFLISGYANNGNTTNNVSTLIGSRPGSTDSTITGLNPGKSKYRNQTYNLNYKSVLDTSGQELNIDFDYSRFSSNQNIIYNNNFYDALGIVNKPPFIFRNITPTKVKIWAGKIDYTYPIHPKLKLETGIKSSYVNTDNDFQSQNFENSNWINDRTKSNRFTYKEQVNAVYANLHKEFKSTNLQFGLRAEMTHSEGDSPTTGDLVKRNYTDLFPTLSIHQNLSKDHEIGFSYSSRINRPDYQSLNPFLYFADLYTYSKGNPQLKPEYANSFELSYGYKKTTNVTFGYTHTRDVMTTTLLTDPVKKTLFIFEQNLASRSTVSMNINRPLAITSWWNTNNDATTYYSRFSSPDLSGVPFENKKWTYMISSIHTFTINSSVNAELSANYQSAQVFGTYVAKPIYSIDLGISKSFADKKANIKLSADDLFNTRQINVKSAIPLQDYKLSQKQESRIFRLSFSYNFGNSGIKAERQRSNSSSNEQNRIKSGN